LSNSSVAPFLVLALNFPVHGLYTNPKNFSSFSHFPSFFIQWDLFKLKLMFAFTIPVLGVIKGVLPILPLYKPSSAYISVFILLGHLSNIDPSKHNAASTGDVGAPCGTPFGAP